MIDAPIDEPINKPIDRFTVARFDLFWEEKSLTEMSDAEWESLCDGCGRCCLQKLEDIDTGEIHFTRIACRQLNLTTCDCVDYPNRQSIVPDCTMVRPLTAEKAAWLPDTCAYRLVAEGKPLFPWHPLISGSSSSVQQAGISVAQLAIPEGDVDLENYPDYVIEFVES